MGGAMTRVVAAILLLAGSAAGADFRAGVARARITPEQPIFLAGYGSRTHPSEGVLHDLWAKALVLVAVTAAVAVAVCRASFLVSQAFAGDYGVRLGDPGVPRALLGAAAYPVAIGLLGLGIGAIRQISSLKMIVVITSTGKTRISVLMRLVSFVPVSSITRKLLTLRP